MEGLRGGIEQAFQIRTQHASLHGDGLIYLVESHHPVHVPAYVQRDAAVHRLHAAGDRRTSAIHIQRYPFCITILQDRLHIFG